MKKSAARKKKAQPSAGRRAKKPLRETPKIDAASEIPAPSIDFPQEGEDVREGYYTIRVSCPSPSDVEVSINNGEWLPCRLAAGYWWFDWQPFGSAPVKLEARSRTRQGEWKKSDVRTCQVIDESPPLHVGLVFD